MLPASTLTYANLVEGKQISLEIQIFLFWDGLCQAQRGGCVAGSLGLPTDVGWLAWIFELRWLLNLGSTTPKGVEAAGASQFPRGITPSSAS